ncbi:MULTISPECIES: hypothetical protein [Micromonospora]|uniref:Uncharacterized protein n=1 Tax=Micromonospora yangpuensis TaxID=683228 RepID=A0A1C6V688_9ACTN|nr:hypothetical protein [Micromonospora yangpuensis]GGM18877.1 hypothetical protein GCM10012279_41550 [Micromonospora yangpuensis]SCL61785.1 hypothetical protein GA0070617_4763 [Micromonospora yangpuensis]
MTEPDRRQQHLPPLGQPPEDSEPQQDPDFANEHDRTAVDRDVITGQDAGEREPESPRGWSGMQR